MSCACGTVTMTVGPKDPSEVKVITFDFVEQLSGLTGVTLVTASISVAVVDGEDPLPGNVLIGPYLIDGIKVRQGLTGGLDGVTYAIRCLGTDSNGLKHEVVGVMPVRIQPEAWVVPA